MTPPCTCLIRGKHGEKPRPRVVPQRLVRLPSGKVVYLPPCETADHRCPVHGIAGSKIRRIMKEQA
jgi:hypothetical protein